MVMKKFLLTSICALGLTVAFNVTEAKAAEDVESDDFSIQQTVRAGMSPTSLVGKSATHYTFRITSSHASQQSFRFNSGVSSRSVNSTNSSQTFSHMWTTAQGNKTYTTSGRVVNAAYGPSNTVYGTANIR